jgi:hypothetical protein
VSFNFRNYADLGVSVKLALDRTPRKVPCARPLLVSPAPCQNGPMPRVDRYDIIGMVLLALLVALWIVHFSLPTPPPDIVLP